MHTVFPESVSVCLVCLRVCVSVCLRVCVSVCVCVRKVTSENVNAARLNIILAANAHTTRQSKRTEWHHY